MFIDCSGVRPALVLLKQCYITHIYPTNDNSTPKNQLENFKIKDYKQTTHSKSTWLTLTASALFRRNTETYFRLWMKCQRKFFCLRWVFCFHLLLRFWNWWLSFTSACEDKWSKRCFLSISYSLFIFALLKKLAMSAATTCCAIFVWRVKTIHIKIFYCIRIHKVHWRWYLHASSSVVVVLRLKDPPCEGSRWCSISLLWQTSFFIRKWVVLMYMLEQKLI